MKYKVYILTYLAYAMNHACRMTLAYNKPNYKQSFGLTALDLGVLDALIYLSYGIGSFFRYYFFRGKFFTTMYLISAICISIFFSFLPFISIFAQDLLYQHVHNNRSILWIDIAIGASMIGYGFSHLSTWQTILALMSKHWHSKKQGSQMGFWTSMSCIGNILGFFLSNLMITTFNVRWQVTMIIFAILNLGIALLMYFLINQPHSQSQQIISSSSSSDEPYDQLDDYIIEENVTTNQCIEYNRNKFLATWDFRLFIITSTCLKILNYSFLFWYPTYLFVQGFQTNSGYITMIFQFSSIIGSFLVGKMMMYDKATCKRFGFDQSENNRVLKVLTIIFKLRNVLMMFFSVSMSFLFLQNFGSLLTNILITILLGCTIGGIFHVNATFNSMALGQHIPRNVDMVSSFSTSFGNCILGLFQLFIGLMVNIRIPPHSTEKDIKHIKAWSYRNFFKIMIVMMLISAICMLFRSGVLALLCQKKKQTENAESVKIKDPVSNIYTQISIKQI